jgi:hypothetical protein
MGCRREGQVAGEEHPPLWDPGHDVVGGVGRRPDVVELDEQVVDVEVEPVGEGDERCHVEVPEVDRREHAFPAGVPEGQDLLPAQPVADDRRWPEEVVAVGVVAVVVGVTSARTGRSLTDRIASR